MLCMTVRLWKNQNEGKHFVNQQYITGFYIPTLSKNLSEKISMKIEVSIFFKLM